MPQPRKYRSNAERQAAYRKRKGAAAATVAASERWQREEDGSLTDVKGRVWDPDTRSWRAPIRSAQRP